MVTHDARQATSSPPTAGSVVARQQQQLQVQQQQPILDWKLQFRDSDIEHAYWQQRCEQQQLLLLDKVVMLFNLLMLFNYKGSSRSRHTELAIQAVSICLSLAQTTALQLDTSSYIKHRPMLMVLQRLWHTALRVQLRLPGATGLSTAGSAAAICHHIPLTLFAAHSGAITDQCAIPSASEAAQPAAMQASSWTAVLETGLISSGVIPNWAHALAYQTPFAAAPWLQVAMLVCAALTDTGTLVQQLSLPALQPLVAACYSVLSVVSNLLMLPLLPLASVPAAAVCPASPALPLLLWLQLFVAVVAPFYVTYHYEASTKAWFWLQQLAQEQNVPEDLAREAQQLLREACELLYWSLPYDWLP